MGRRADEQSRTTPFGCVLCLKCSSAAGAECESESESESDVRRRGSLSLTRRSTERWSCCRGQERRLIDSTIKQKTTPRCVEDEGRVKRTLT